MAVATGIGFDLSFLDKLDEADKKLQQFIKMSQGMSSTVIKSWQDIATQGVDPFLQKMKEQKKAFESIANMDLSGAGEGMKRLASEASAALVSVNHVVDGLSKLAQSKAVYDASAGLYDLKKIDDQITRAEQAEKTRAQNEARAHEQRRQELQRLLDDEARAREQALEHELSLIGKEIQQRRDAENAKRQEYDQTHAARQREYDEMGKLLQDEDRLRKELFDAQLERIRREGLEKQRANKEARDAEIKAHEERQREYDEMGRKLQEYANINLSTKASSQQYAAESEQQRRFYESLIREKYEKEYEEFYKTALREREETAKINQQISRDKIEQLGRESRERLKIEQMIRDTQKRNHDAREKELNDLFREQERLAKAQAQYDSKSRRERYKAYTTSYEGAIRTSNKAKTLAQEIQAVKNLEAARAKLNKTEADYQKKLDDINARILQHNKNIQQATAGAKALDNAHSKLGTAIASAFSIQSIYRYIGQIAKVRGEMELQQRSIEAILQNKDAANEVWQKTIDLAVRSPFRIKDLVTYTKQLAAYRVEADKLYDTNKMLADVSAGLGVDMQRLILAFGQVKSANFLRGTELRQFTEAGIPMLDELAKLYSQMERANVTSGEVFDRISKRMVLFEDVEEVFKRMTSAGGTFYRMQEIQSETLKGQISNLKDSIDIMLNNIGKASDGIMKRGVKTAKLLIDNYELFIPILKAVIAALALYKINMFVASEATLRMARAMKISAISASGFGGIWTTLRVGVAQFGKTMAKTAKTLVANPWILLATAIMTATAKILKFRKELKEVDSDYGKLLDKQSDVYLAFRQADKKDTVEEQIAERRKQLQALVDMAKNEYGIILDINVGEVDEKELEKEFNRIRQHMIEVNVFSASFTKQMMKTNAISRWFGEGTFGLEESMFEDIDDLGDSYNKLYKELINNTGRTTEIIRDKWAKMTEEQRNAISDSQKKAIEDLEKPIQMDENMADYIERIKKAYEELLNSGEVKNNKISRFIKSFNRDTAEAKEEFALFANQFRKEVEKIKDDKKKVEFLDISIGAMAKEKEWSEFEENYIRRLTEKEFNIKFKPEEVEPETLEAWQESYNSLFADTKGWRKIEKKTVTQKQVVDRLNGSYSATKELIEAIERAGEDSILEGGAYEGTDLTKLKQDLAEIKAQLDWFGAKAKGDKEEKSIKILQKRINLLKEVNKKYLELEKTFDAETAKEKVMEAYSDTFREAFAGTGVELDMYKVMTQVITDSKKVGEEMGSNLSEGIINKLKELEGAGTYIRSATEDVIEFTKAQEEFRPNAYLDKMANVWTIGYGTTSNAGIGVNVVKGMVIDQAKAEEWLLKTYKSKEQALNSILDKHKDLIITQEQYNALIDAAYNGEGAAKAIEFAYGSWEHFERYLHGLKAMKQANKKAVVVDVEEIKKEWEALDTIQEKLALTLKWSGIRTGGKVSSALQDRAIKRAEMFSGDLDIANQLEAVLVRIAGMDFTTTEGMVEALGHLKEIAEKEGPEAKNVLSQAISGLEAEIGVRLKKESDKRLNDEVQDLFDQYELTLDLKKLNVPKDLAEGLFGAKYLDLEGLRKALTDRASEFVGTEQQEQYKKFLERINEMDRKALIERTKTYLDYAKLTIGERAKIKLEELRKLKEIEETFAEKEGDSESTKAYKKDMRGRASSRVKQDAENALRNLEWDEFQKTDTFTSIFADIDDASDALINHMIKKIRDFKNEWKDMPLEDVRTLVNKLNELEGALAERSPWVAYRNAKDAVNTARENAKYSFESEDARNLYGKGKNNKDYIAAVQIENEYQEEKALNAEREAAAIESILSLKTKEREGSIVNLGLTREQMEYTRLSEQELRDLLKTKQGEATTARAVVLANGQVLVQYRNQEKSLLKQKETLEEVQNMAGDLYEAFTKLSESLGGDRESPAAIFADMGMNMMSAVLNTIMLQAQLKAVEVGAYAAGTALNTAMGIIGWIVMGIQLLVAGITAIAKINDNKIVAQLEEQASIIEEQRSLYEEIEEKVDKAYNVEQLRQYNDEMKRSVELEIQALEASIALEKSRKDSDEEQIKEWEKEIGEARKRLEESTQEMKEMVGGIFDLEDFTSGFVDAWWDAMEEGMDGIDALNDHFEDTMKDLVKKQALYKGAQKIMEQVLNAINDDLEGDFDIDDWAEIERIANKANVDLDAFLQGYRDIFNSISDSAGGSLSALQKGIQGVTEDTAQVIESILNSMRLIQAEGYEQMKQQTNYLKTIKDTITNALSPNGALWVKLANQPSY